MGIKVVSVSGPSGSGKSTLVYALVARIPNSQALLFDDYKSSTKFPDDLSAWLKAGCNPEAFETPRMVEDLCALHGETQEGWVIVEEPFGRGRKAIAEFIDVAVCIDIPPEVALSRTIRRAALAAPDHMETATLLRNIIDFVDQYLHVSRASYAVVNERVKQDCDLIVDGTKDVELLAAEVLLALQERFGPLVPILRT